MSLDIGTLVGEVTLETSPMMSAAAAAGAKLEAEGRGWATSLGNAGTNAAKAAGDGLATGSAGWKATLEAAADQAGRAAGDAIPTAVQPGLDETEAAFRESGRESSEQFEEGIDGATLALGVGAIGAAAAAAFGAGLTEAMDIEAGTDKVAASLNLSAQQAETAGRVAGEVYANGWGESVPAVQAALAAVMSSIQGMRNASEADLQAATTAAIVFADTMEVDVTRAAQVAGNMIATGLAPNAVAAFDMLVRASQKVPVALREDVLDAIDEYGVFFNQLGIDGPAALALLARGAEQGMYGIDKAGDAVKEFTIRSTDMSASSVAAYDMIGLNAENMANRILAGGDTASGALDKIINGLLDINDPATRANAAIALFGTPLEDLSTKDIPKFLASLKSGTDGLGKWQGATDKAGTTLSDNAKGNLTTFWRQLKMVFVDFLGGTVIPKLTELTRKVNAEVGPALATIATVLSGTVLPKLQEWATIIADVAVPALNTLAEVLGSVAGFMAEHSTVAKALGIAIVALTVITQAHAAAMTVSAAGGMAKWLMQTKLVTAATKAWAAVQWAMNLAMSANPIGLAVVAIAALVAGVILAWKHSETFRTVVLAVWDAIKSAVSAVIGWLTSAIPAAWDFIKSASAATWDAIKSAIGAVWDGIKAVISAVLDGIKAYITLVFEAYKTVITTVLDAIKTYITTAWNLYKTIITTALNTIKTVITTAWNAVKNATSTAWNAVKDVVSTAANKVVDFIRELPGRFVNGLSTLKSKVTEVFGSAMAAARDKVADIVATIVDKVGAIPGKLKDLGSKFVDAGKALIGKFFDGLKLLGDIGANVGKTLINGVIAGINAGINAINSVIPNSIGVGPVSIDLPDNPFPNVPMLAGGGRATGAMLAMIGEGAEPETVLPDSLLRGLLERVHESGRAAGAATAPGDGADMSEVERLLAALLAAFDAQPRRGLQLQRKGVLGG